MLSIAGGHFGRDRVRLDGETFEWSIPSPASRAVPTRARCGLGSNGWSDPMRLFRRRREVRESAGPFTDATVAAIVAQAGGTLAGDPSTLAALEVAAGLYARAFARAVVEPAIPALCPATRALIARDLIRRGESLHVIEVAGSRLGWFRSAAGICAGRGPRTRGGTGRTCSDRPGM